MTSATPSTSPAASSARRSLPRPLALPDFPWDSLAPYRARAAEHPGGVVDLAVGTPVDDTPDLAREALAAASNAPGAQYSPGERYGRVYQINYLRCIFCGMCIEACPTRALTMTHEIDELVGPNRTGLIYEKQDLLAPVPDGALAAPHPMVEGTEDGDYYRGRVAGSTQAQIDWVRAHRPDDPSLDDARAKAAPTASDRGSRHTVKGALR